MAQLAHRQYHIILIYAAGGGSVRVMAIARALAVDSVQSGTLLEMVWN